MYLPAHKVYQKLLPVSGTYIFPLATIQRNLFSSFSARSADVFEVLWKE